MSDVVRDPKHMRADRKDTDAHLGRRQELLEWIPIRAGVGHRVRSAR